MKPLVFLTMPHGFFRHDYRSLLSWQTATLGYCQVTFGPVQDPTGPIGSPVHGVSTLRCWNFNCLWAMAWNGRQTFRITHFAMLHDDIECRPGWLDILVREQERTGADFVGAAVAMKDDRGLSSTGLGDPDLPLDHSPRSEKIQRLSMHEIHALPETFSADDACDLLGYKRGSKVLLLNSGCWACRFDRPWVDVKIKDQWGERLAFHFDEMNHIWLADGKADARARGEDWHASRIALSLGCRLLATRKVQTVHHGDFAFGNWPAWGTQKTDQTHAEKVAFSEQVAVHPAQD